jgi:hypothetical protein
LGEIGINTPHMLGTAEPPGTTGPASAAGPTGAAGAAPWLVSSPKHHLSLEHNLDEHDSLRKRRFDQMLDDMITSINRSTYPVAQPPQPSSRCNPRHSRAWPMHHTAQGWAGRTYELACWTKPTQGADLQPPQEQ